MNKIKRMMMDMRGLRGLTQKEVAARAGIDVMTLSRWVNGHASPQGEKYERFFKVYLDVIGDDTPPEDRDDVVDVRNKAVINMHRRGYSHGEIGSIFGITRERVRQIVERHGEKPRRG